MSTPDLDLTLREALTKTLAADRKHGFLSYDEYDALVALRDACPEPRWLPTEDGVAMYVDVDGDQTPYHVRDGKVDRFLRPDGTLRHPIDPTKFGGTWAPYVHEVTPEQITRAASAAICFEMRIRAALPALGCREVTR